MMVAIAKILAVIFLVIFGVGATWLNLERSMHKAADEADINNRRDQ